MVYVILINLLSTFMLTGLIWTIQIIHYPSFKYISPNKFPDFMIFHMNNITYIVMPLMLLELMSASYLLISIFSTVTIINFVFVLFIWLSTCLLSIPCHNKLKVKYDLKTIEKLVITNWPRTILWSLKSILSILIMIKYK
jgi:hypothetical protein